MRGFEPAGGLVARRVQTAGESRGFAVTRLLTHWPEIAGAEIAAMCQPIKVGYTREGMGATLTLLVSPAQAPLVEMRKEALRARVNAAYGYAAISRIHLTQTAAHGFAEAQAAFGHAPKADPAALPPSPQAQASVAGVQDEGLKQALERLAQNILSRDRQTKG
jgi:hypothetical protein